MIGKPSLQLLPNRIEPPQLVPNFILEQFSAGQTQGQLEAVTLSVDISGFTTLTETLFNYYTEGADVLGTTLEKIFRPLVKQVHAAGGLIPLYAGDSFVAIFVVENGRIPATLAERVWRLALAMQNYFSEDGQSRLFATTHGQFEIGIKVGLALGKVYWGIPGRENHYTFRGPAIRRAVKAQKQGRQGSIIVHQSLVGLLPELPAEEGEPFVITSAPPTEVKPPDPARPFPTATIDQLRPFVPTAVLNLPVEAEFRKICPVFIKFAAPVEGNALHYWVTEAMALVNRYGGTFGQLDFDDQGGIMVFWFGAPISYENNTVRAIQCLMALQQKSANQFEAEAIPQWRAGLTYGLVWAGLRGTNERQEYGAVGDVVNTASRIADRAETGQIWLDALAAQRLEAYFQLKPLGLYELKGKKSAIPLFALVAEKNQLQIMFRGNMVGREAELEALMLAVSPIFQGQFGGVASVFGDAGMGKSRLVFELQQYLARWVTWAVCPAEEILRQSLNPFRHFLRDFFGQIPNQSTAERRAVFEIILAQLLEQLANSADPRAADLHQELGRTDSMLAALIDLYWPDSLYAQLPPRLRSENTFIALICLFKAISLQRPLIIQLEDSHWLDADSQRLLMTLSQALSDYPVALIISSRYLEDGRQPQPNFAAETPEITLHLKTLSKAGLRGMAEQLLGQSVDETIIELLAQKSNGQPFFAEQFVLDLQECGQLQQQDGRYTLGANRPTYYPSSLNAILVTRLDRLSPPVRQQVSQRPAWQADIALRHAHYATAINDNAAALQQAKAAIQLAQENNDPHRQVLGYLAWARTIIWQRDFITAQEPLSEAYRITAEHNLIDLEAEILRDLGYITSQLGDYAQGSAYTKKALLINRELGDKVGENANLANLGGMYLDQGYFSKAQGYIEACLALNRQMGNRLNTAIALHGLGELLCRLGRYEQAENHFREAVSHYQEAENEKLETAGLYWLGLVLYYQGQYEAAGQCHEAALALAPESLADRGDAHYGLGLTLAANGRFETAEQHLQQAISLRQQASYTALAIEATAALAEISHRQGKASQAQAYLNEILTYLDKGGNLDGTEAPFRIQLICYQLLQPFNPLRANKLLQSSYRQLYKQAANVADKKGREIFLQNIPWHRKIIEEWDRLQETP